ncbi:MAG: cofactor-independent phosphoglycerate mutase [Deltaproteobacteria bacterium]|jgi:2,3-bisphosphoglycerate-independent phosphoglycerate mutase|nr:cofactor-independent phosphoglycerate mutase [Deltaproteobacteria bacterium]
MKYVILIGDGMGDYPIDSLQGKTPLEYASTPNLDYLAREGLLARCATIPEGMPPGSDVAIMSLLGYSAKGVLTGRGPLEARALGIPLPPNALAFRLNLVTVKHEDGDTFMLNHAAGDIPSAEAKALLETLNKELPLSPGQALYPGVNYRNILIWPEAPLGLASIPPHDHLDKSLAKFLNDPALQPLMDLVKASWKVLENHPINLARKQKNLPPANSIWLWGQGSTPTVKSYQERWGITGATVSAVDIIRGLAITTGLVPIDVPGATGDLYTNYAGKVEAALKALQSYDLAVIHLEAPDECSHQGDLNAKIAAIENYDSQIVGPVFMALKEMGDFRLLCSCDHFTPVVLKTHVSDPVPFVFYDSTNLSHSGALGYCEKYSQNGPLLPDGPSLGHLLFGPEKE